MNPTRFPLLVSLLALLTPTVPARGQSTAFNPGDLWKDPGFVQEFMGSYGFLSDLEPRISAAEQELFKELAEMIGKDPAAAAKRLEQALTPESSAALDFILGNLCVQLTRYDDATKNYEAALKKFPRFRRANKNLAIVYVQQGKTREGIEQLTQVLELGGEDGSTYGLLGYCHLSVDHYLSAGEAYRKALLFAPENVDWKLGLARCLVMQQRHKEAVALLEELIQQDPNKADYWLYQANAFLGVGEISHAAHNYEIVRRMGQATGPSLMALGDIYLSENLTDLALGAYLDSIQKAPDQDVKRPLRAAEILATRQAWPEMGTLLAEIKTRYASKLTDQDREQILRLESRLALATGDAQQAAGLLEKLIERNPLDGESLLILAGYYERNEQPEKAELLLGRAEKLMEYQARALVQHGQLLVGQGKYDRAVTLLEQAQQIRPREAVSRYLEQVQRLARESSPP